MFMVHPSTDNFLRSGLGCPRQPFYLGVYRTMNAFKIVAASLLLAAVAVTAANGAGAGTDREHILGEPVLGAAREHIL
ncbi:hypothetical protein GCM10017774_88540 [Lentzea cavernae]|uniref:Uncharacterized protein n=1 Tax=Lentzea cavernae TaxID=2020703 RepID=A0ABQ3MVE7_9PSEU|nr:hypothetical protein GCM10017774_88540 [Lentzea cavernae]